MQSPYKSSMGQLKPAHTWPCRLSGIDEYRLGDEMLLYSSKTETGISLNNSSKAIWERCDGRHTMLEISQELSQRLGIAGNAPLFDELLVDVIECITQLGNLGLLTFADAPQKKSAEDGE